MNFTWILRMQAALNQSLACADDINACTLAMNGSQSARMLWTSSASPHNIGTLCSALGVLCVLLNIYVASALLLNRRFALKVRSMSDGLGVFSCIFYFYFFRMFSM